MNQSFELTYPKSSLNCIQSNTFNLVNFTIFYHHYYTTIRIVTVSIALFNAHCFLFAMRGKGEI